MIEKSEVNAAVAAATRSLAEEPAFAWIKNSALLERAYFVGLFCGLQGIASEDDVGHILVRAMRDTMFPRSADDSFQSTPTGVLFDSVRRELFREAVNGPALLAAIQALADHVDTLDGDWTRRVRHTKTLLQTADQLSRTTLHEGEGQKDAAKQDLRHDAMYRRAEELEHCARHLALVEIDHKIWKRLED